MGDILGGPVTVESDGWNVSSFSADATPESLTAQLAESKDPAADAKAAAAANPLANPKGVESTPADAVATTEATPAVEATPATEQTPAVAAPAKKQSWQSRFDEERARSGQFERDLIAERTRREALEQRMERLETARTAPASAAPAVPGQAPAAAAAPATTPAVQAKPEPTWAEYEKAGKSWDEYQLARESWVFAESERRGREAALAATDERLKADRTTAEEDRKKADARAAQQTRERELGQRLDTMRTNRPDFDTIVEANLHDVKSPVIDHIVITNKQSAEILLHLAEHRTDALSIARLFDTPDLKRAVVQAIATSETPVKLLEHFAQKPEEFQRIAKLDAVDGVRAIAKLEVGFAGAPATTTATVPSVSNARPPFRVVNGGQTPKPGESTKQLEEMEFSPEYVGGMNSRDRERRRQRVAG